MPKTLLCAATGTEAQGARRGIQRAGLEGRFEILKTGIGPLRAARALEAFLAAREPRQWPERIVSTGFAGSWSPGLRAGEWIEARSLFDENGACIPLPALPAPPAAALARAADIFSVAEIHASPPQALIASAPGDLPFAVDMESFALARIALRNGIPASVLRFVTDSQDAPLPELVRHFTRAAAPPPGSALSARARALLDGARALAAEPASLARLARDGARWREALASGWARFAAPITGSWPGPR